MTARGPSLRPSPLVVLLASALVAASCAWDPWIPGENKRKPEPVLVPAELSRDLALGSPYVDELDCFSHQCQQRFRVVVTEPGQLTVTTSVGLATQDEQARLVLEGVRGVLAQNGSGRGPFTDPPILTVRETVDVGVYFVLLQSVGATVPYEILATLTPSEAPPPEPEVAEPPPLPTEPLPMLTKVELGPRSAAAYDPGVRFSQLRTYAFVSLPRAGDAPAGTPVEQPKDRAIRRFMADALALKGFHQATGSEVPDFVVGFSTSTGSSTWYAITYPVLFDTYVDSGLPYGPHVYESGSLVVDIVEARTDRLAWHAYTRKGMGPGITPGEKTSALLREAVTDVLADFPPVK